MATTPKPTRQWLARARRALRLGVLPIDLVGQIRGVPPLPGPRAWAVGCKCPACRNVHEPRTVTSRCPIHWQRLRRVLKRIDPGWSGKTLQDVEPVQITLPDGRSPVDLILERRRDPALKLPTGTEEVTICRHCGCVSIVGEPPKCRCGCKVLDRLVEVVEDLETYGYAGGWGDGPFTHRAGARLRLLYQKGDRVYFAGADSPPGRLLGEFAASDLMRVTDI